ncbi:MAG: hypothetical protein JXR76_19825 [Deltaproteobacteria bacterium]|nr:hypothetical protein [Deltaproteobacteria bacterium]
MPALEPLKSLIREKHKDSAEYDDYLTNDNSSTTFADHMQRKLAKKQRVFSVIRDIGISGTVLGAIGFTLGAVLLQGNWMTYSAGAAFVCLPLIPIGAIGYGVNTRKLEAVAEERERQKKRVPTFRFVGVSPYLSQTAGGISASSLY